MRTSVRIRLAAALVVTALSATVLPAAAVSAPPTPPPSTAPSSPPPSTAPKPTASPKPTGSPQPTASPKPTASPQPTPARPATRGLPAGSGSGRRIVYSRARQHVWVVDAAGAVIRDFPVTGRRDWPRRGTYRVFSKSPSSYSTHYHVYYRWMIRFTIGHTTAIGFHSIPTTASGRPIQRESQLGQALGLGGCVRSAMVNATWLYRWAGIGTKVVVL